MRILITENQLKELIDEFISKKFGKLEMITRHPVPGQLAGSYVYIDNRGRNVMQTNFINMTMLIEKEIWDSIGNKFNLDHDEVKYYLKCWLDDNKIGGGLIPKRN